VRRVLDPVILLIVAKEGGEELIFLFGDEWSCRVGLPIVQLVLSGQPRG
jgi:hypothetical protein